MRDGWREVALGEIAEQRVEPVDLDPDEAYINLGVKWYAEGTFQRAPKSGSEIKAKRLFRVRPGQFVYNRLFATEGSFAVVQDCDAVAVASNEFPVFDVDASELLVDYLGLYFQRPTIWAQVAQECVGTTKSRSRWKEERFTEHRFLLPPLDEQRRIVDLIGTLDGAVGATRLSARHLGVLLEKVRSRLPEGALRPVGDCLTAIESGISTKPVEGPGPRKNVLTLGAIRPAAFDPAGVKDVGVAELPERALLRDGELLISRSNTPERVGYVCLAREVPAKTYLPDLAWRLVPDEAVATPSYLEQALSSAQFRVKLTGAASGTNASMQKINRSNFTALTIPVPDLETQHAYVEPLAAMGETLNALKSAESNLRSLRSNLLAALLAGQHEIPASYDELMEEVPA